MARQPNLEGKDSPDRDILTPNGCQVLLAVGERALMLLMKRGLPYVETSNSYRFPRAAIIEWMTQESLKPKTKLVY